MGKRCWPHLNQSWQASASFSQLQPLGKLTEWRLAPCNAAARAVLLGHVVALFTQAKLPEHGMRAVAAVVPVAAAAKAGLGAGAGRHTVIDWALIA